MAGRFIDVKKDKLRRITEVELDFVQIYTKLKDDDKELEIYSDGPTVSSHPEQPYLFSTHPNRLYLQYKYTGVFFSCYTCAFPDHFGRHYKNQTNVYKKFGTCHLATHFVIILMDKGAFAAGIFKNSNLVESIELYNHTEKQKEENEFKSQCKATVDKWDAKNYFKYIRCRQEDFELFGAGEYSYNREDTVVEGVRHAHIPFVTDYPTVDEVKRVNKRIFTVIAYSTEKELLKEKRKVAPADQVPNRKQPKEAVLFDLDEIHELIMTNDGTGLADALCESQPHSQFLNYVNSELLLSIATHKNKPNAVKALLELGASVLTPVSFYFFGEEMPYNLARTDEMRMVFIEFREKHPEAWDWKRAKVPTRAEFNRVKTLLEDALEVKEHREEEKRKARDEKRQRRRDKLDKRTLHLRDD